MGQPIELLENAKLHIYKWFFLKVISSKVFDVLIFVRFWASYFTSTVALLSVQFLLTPSVNSPQGSDAHPSSSTSQFLPKH